MTRRLLTAAFAAVLLAAGVTSSVPATAAPQPRGGLPEECRTADPSPWRFMFVGDSMTAGWAPGQSQQRPYWSWLMPRMWGVPRVSVGSQVNVWGVHEGIPGQTPGQLLTRLPGLMANYHPDVVVLLVGTNLDGDGVTTFANVAGDVNAVLAADPCVRLLVGTAAYEYDSLRSAHAQFINAHIPGLVDQLDSTGSRVRWVDLTMAPISGTTDHLHWTSTQADAVSWRVWKEVQHFVGITVGGDRWLPYSGAALVEMPARTGTSTTG